MNFKLATNKDKFLQLNYNYHANKCTCHLFIKTTWVKKLFIIKNYTQNVIMFISTTAKNLIVKIFYLFSFFFPIASRLFIVLH